MIVCVCSKYDAASQGNLRGRQWIRIIYVLLLVVGINNTSGLITQNLESVYNCGFEFKLIIIYFKRHEALHNN